MRAKILRFTPEFLIDLCKTRSDSVAQVVTCKGGLPEDAEFVRAAVRDALVGGRWEGAMEVAIVVQSPSFDEVPKGHKIPELVPTFHARSPHETPPD